MPYVLHGCGRRRRFDRLIRSSALVATMCSIALAASPMTYRPSRACGNDASLALLLAAAAACYQDARNKRHSRFRSSGIAFDVCVDDWTASDFKTTFRFEKQDFHRLVEVLGIPQVVVTRLRYTTSGEVALLLYLYR